MRVRCHLVEVLLLDKLVEVLVERRFVNGPSIKFLLQLLELLPHLLRMGTSRPPMQAAPLVHQTVKLMLQLLLLVSLLHLGAHPRNLVDCPEYVLAAICVDEAELDKVNGALVVIVQYIENHPVVLNWVWDA